MYPLDAVSRRTMLVFYLAAICVLGDKESTRAQAVLAAASTSSTGDSGVAVSAAKGSTTSLIQQAFLKEQKALVFEEMALQESGAPIERIIAWRKQNAARFDAQRQRVVNSELLSASSTFRQATSMLPPIRADASLTQKQFFNTQAVLASNDAAVHQKFLPQSMASGQSITVAQSVELNRQAEYTFRQQNAALLKSQGERLQALSRIEAGTQQALPAPVAIPANASPQRAALLKAEGQLELEVVQLHNKVAGATPAVRKATIHAWLAQNSKRLVQLQREAQSISITNSTAN